LTKVKLALFLPFKADEIILDPIDRTRSLLIDRNLHTISLDFLTGVKFALKTASNNGISIDLSVFDTENDILIINGLVRVNDFSKFDAIIGPLIPSNFDFLSSKRELINIPKISPLSTNSVYLRKNVYQSIPRKQFLREKMTKYLKKKLDSTQNIVLVVDSINRKVENELKKKFPYSIILRPEKEDYLLPELVDSLLVDSIPNKVILESESFPLIASVISQMNAQNNSKRKVQLFTTYRGNAYETNNISNKVMGGINFSYPIYYKKLSSENLTDFQKEYIELYGKLPNKESTRAYDLTLDILLRIGFREKLNNSIDVGETEYIENRFFYNKTENESYTNKAFFILEHSGYEVMEIKDWED
jgi:ABC-type branched-subunit amino acid transport system substrate-binding protein